MIVQPGFLPPLILALILHTSVDAAPLPRHKTRPGSPDLTAIVRLAVAKNTARTRQIEDFTYTEFLKRKLISSHGKTLKQETYMFQTVLIRGSQYRRLIKRNGHPPVGGEADDEQKREAEFVEKMKVNAAIHNQPYATYLKGPHLPFEQLTDQFSFMLKDTKTVRGRKTYVVEAVPRSDYQPSTEEEKLAKNFTITLWIDQRDNEIVRGRGEVIA